MMYAYVDMFFEDDVKLFGLMRRYSDEHEIDELKNQVVQYVKTQIHDVNAEIQEFQTANAMQEPGAEQVFEVSTRNHKCIKLLELGGGPRGGALSINHNTNLFALIDGLTRGPDAGDAQTTEDGANAIESTEAADAAASAAEGEPDDVRLGRESQPAAQGNEAIPSQPAPIGTPERAHSASAAKSQTVRMNTAS